MSETVELPWLDEPVQLSKAVELIAQADEDDEQTIQDVKHRIELLERRLQVLQDASDVKCPSCGGDEGVYKAGVGAAKLVDRDALSETNVDALNRESHVCIECSTSFTPAIE